MALIDSLRAQTDGPHDGALLRFSLGNALLAEGDAGAAVAELRRALEFDPNYSAAWKLLGKALADSGDPDAAMAAYRDGIDTANERGDIQAAKEMRVFLRRLERDDAPPTPTPPSFRTARSDDPESS